MADDPLEQPYNNLDPDRPLTGGEDDPFYVDLSRARGDDQGAIAVIAQRIERSTRREKQLLTGHRGCGKSTELRRLKKMLEAQDFFVVYIDAEAELDVGDIAFTDVFLSIARGVCRDSLEAGVEIDEALLESVRSWFDDASVTRNENRQAEVAVKTEAKIGLRQPLIALLELLTGFTASIKASSETRKDIRKKLERRASELIARVNELVTELRARLAKRNLAGLVLTVDGLEKIVFKQLNGTDTHQSLFVHHGEQLKAVDCPTVYTIPISLLSSSNIGQIFTQPTVLPMVKVTKHRSREAFEPGVVLLREAIQKRVGELGVVFEDRSTVDDFIAGTGGHIRDLLRLVRYAIDYADDKVSPVMAARAIAKLTMEYDRLTRDSDLECLARAYDEQRIPSSADTDQLLLNLLVLEYQNGVRWHDVHPCVVRTPKFTAALAETRKPEDPRPAAGSHP